MLEQHEKVKKESILYLEDVYATGRFFCDFKFLPEFEIAAIASNRPTLIADGAGQ